MTQGVIYALQREEYDDYINQIYQNRSNAFEVLFDFLKEKDPEEYIATFSFLSEYFSILYQFENLLETAVGSGKWDSSNDRWFLDDQMALSVVVHIHSLHTCTQELLNHNISFSIH